MAAAEEQLLTAATTGLQAPGPQPTPPRTRTTPPRPIAALGAPGLDPGQLRRLGEDLLYRADPDAVEERERKRFERRHLSFGLTLDGAGT